MRFSERYGHTAVRHQIQKESMDEELRNGLWNVLSETYWSLTRVIRHGRFETTNHLGSLDRLSRIAKALWEDYFKIPTDTIPNNVTSLLSWLRDIYYSAKWYEVYDFLEFMASCEKRYAPKWDMSHDNYNFSQKFIGKCNEVLEREMSAFRFVGENVLEITSEQEIAEIEKSLNLSGPFDPVKNHLSRSLTLLSDRKTPDYRNSIKEAISAVEALSKIVTANPKATLGDALKILEQQGKIHGALKTSFSALYGYASDADGIRHAMLEEPSVKQEDARLMLVVCSAFTNYVIAKLKQ